MMALQADSIGRRNTFNQGGVYGTTYRVNAEVDRGRSNALAGRAIASA